MIVVKFLHSTIKRSTFYTIYAKIAYHAESNIHIISMLKVPKREIFVTELIILSHPICIGDLRTKAKNRFV